MISYHFDMCDAVGSTEDSKPSPRQSLTVNIHCEFSSRFHSDSKRIRSGFESKRRESPRIHNVFAQQYGFANFGRVFTDSLRDSVMGSFCCTVTDDDSSCRIDKTTRFSRSPYLWYRNWQWKPTLYHYSRDASAGRGTLSIRSANVSLAVA